jgi:hypothetical protein
MTATRIRTRMRMRVRVRARRAHVVPPTGTSAATRLFRSLTIRASARGIAIARTRTFVPAIGAVRASIRSLFGTATGRTGA